MRRIRSAAAFAATALTATGLAAAAVLPAQAAAAVPGWRLVFSQHYGSGPQWPSYPNNLTAVAATGLNNAWAFGSEVPGDPLGPVIALHWNGRAWASAALPVSATDQVPAVSAPAANDVWVATSGASDEVLHYNGSAWSVAKSWGMMPGPHFPGALSGITALSPSNVWVFGQGSNGPFVGTWHLAGTTWTQVTAGTGSAIASASALSPSNIWAIGVKPVAVPAVVHYNGASWSYVTAPALSGLGFASIVAESPTNVWVAAYNQYGPVLVHYNGRSWARAALPWKTIRPGSMASDGRGGVWFTATDLSDYRLCYVVHRTAAGAWSRITVASVPYTKVGALALIPGTTSLWGASSVQQAGPSPSKAGIWADGKI